MRENRASQDGGVNALQNVNFWAEFGRASSKERKERGKRKGKAYLQAGSGQEGK